MPNIYSYEFQTSNGDIHSFKEFEGKPILIVNTATQCGLTPQFGGLQQLHEKYKDEGLVVLGFPCNQFLGQEPLKDEEMQQTCEINHGVTFQLTKKIDVNGKNEHPVFTYLKKKKGGFLFSRIKWNFTKFLVDKNGEPVKRFAPNTKPAEIEADIKGIL